MNELQLLLVEDEDNAVDIYQAVLDDYSEQHGRPIEMYVAKSLDEARCTLGPHIDAAIVDLNLGKDTTDGGRIIDQLKDYFRVPVAVLTATPADAEVVPPVVRVFTKGEHGFEEVLNRLWRIHEIGLTKIMGGRGQLETGLNQVFLNNLLPTLDVWIDYGKRDPNRTEKALLRYALGHLMARLEGDETPCYPEEVYLAPPLEKRLTTGSLLRRKDGHTRHLVVTPACDLVPRGDGKPKTDVVVVAEVVPQATVFETLEAKAGQKKKLDAGRKKKLMSNSDVIYLHWLPACDAVPSSFVDFRRLETVSLHQLDDVFDCMEARIAPSFIKEIVSRFSTFYARQGQPFVVSPSA